MKPKKQVVNLSILLVKPAFTDADQIVDTAACQTRVQVPISGYGEGTLYIRRTPAKPPKWTRLFQDFLDPTSVSIPGVSALFLLKVSDRIFLLTFGQAGRHLVKDDVCEERFGLICALNTVDPKTFRCVDVQSLDAIQSHSRIQSGEETTPDQFGLDIEQDMLKAIVGSPLDSRLGSRMTGSDALSVAVKMELSDLPNLLSEYRTKYETPLNAANHQWVNNIAAVTGNDTILQLEDALLAKLNAKDYSCIWLSIPEIIDWSFVKGFMFTGGKSILYTDITLAAFLRTVDPSEPITMDLLYGRSVLCSNEEHEYVFKKWSVYRCMYAELELSGRKYILNGGKWYAVDVDFVARTDAEFAAIPASALSLPIYKGGGEGQYNADVCTTAPDKYALLDDKKKVMHGGGHGQVEICDLLWIEKALIHVKLYGKSSVFSHLFAQGFVSGQLIQTDPDFRKKVKDQLVSPFTELFDIDKRPSQDEFTIVYAVISSAPAAELYLPFFSRVNLNNTRKVLKGFGYKVELLKIDVDEDYSKKVTAPPKKKRKLKSLSPT